MKKWFLVPALTLGLTMVCALGCGGSGSNAVVPAPLENVDTTPDVDESSAEYQKSMSSGS